MSISTRTISAEGHQLALRIPLVDADEAIRIVPGVRGHAKLQLHAEPMRRDLDGRQIDAGRVLDVVLAPLADGLLLGIEDADRVHGGHLYPPG
jgi:hypothetical protein